MRILMTGATGLIGKELGKRLVSNGHELVVVSRDPKRARFEVPFPARFFAWKGANGEFPLEALKDVDVIVNLAGEPIAPGRWTAEKKQRIRDSRVLGTRRIIEALSRLEFRPRALVQASAIGIYGDRDDEILTETSEPGEGFLVDVVKEWEAEARAAEKLGLRLAIVRTAMVLSTRGGALAKLLPLFAKGVGGQFAGGLQWMSWIHIEDIVRVYTYCVEYESASGVYNASAPEPVRNDRFTLLLARALGRSPFLPVPDTALKLALGEAATAVLWSERVIPERLSSLGFQFKYPELEGALQHLCGPFKGNWQEFVFEQWIAKKPEEVFSFFADETNLEKLMPRSFDLHVLGKSTPTLKEGTVVDFRFTLYGFPMHGQVKILEWEPGRRFVDELVKGPFKAWRHAHELWPMADGTLLRDRVRCQLPAGWFGNVLAGWKAENDIKAIFEFRRKRIGEIF